MSQSYWDVREHHNIAYQHNAYITVTLAVDLIFNTPFSRKWYSQVWIIIILQKVNKSKKKQNQEVDHTLKD